MLRLQFVDPSTVLYSCIADLQRTLPVHRLLLSIPDIGPGWNIPAVFSDNKSAAACYFRSLAIGFPEITINQTSSHAVQISKKENQSTSIYANHSTFNLQYILQAWAGSRRKYINLERKKYPYLRWNRFMWQQNLDWKFDEQLMSRLRSKKRSHVSTSKIAPTLRDTAFVWSHLAESCDPDCVVSRLSRSRPSINVNGRKAVVGRWTTLSAKF